MLLAVAISYILFSWTRKSSNTRLYLTLERIITAINKSSEEKGTISIDRNHNIEFKPEKETYVETIFPPSDVVPLSQIEIKPLWTSNNFILGKEYKLKFRIENKKYNKTKAILYFKHNNILLQGKQIRIWKLWATYTSVKFTPLSLGNHELGFYVWESEDNPIPLCYPLSISIEVINPTKK